MKTDLIYGVEDRPPFKDALFAALQHLLAIFVAIITPPLIIASALKLDVEKTSFLVSMSLFASGVSTFIQCRRFGVIGARLLCIQGTSFSFIGPIIATGMVGGLPLIFGSCMAAAPIEMIVSRTFKYLRNIITPLVSGIVVLLIGLSLIKVGIVSCGGGYAAMDNGTFATWENLSIAALVLLSVLFFNRCGNKYLRMSSIVLGLCLGYGLAFALGKVDMSALNVEMLMSFNIPQPFKYGVDFNVSSFIAIGLVYLITAIEATGDVTANSMISGLPIEGDSYLKRVSGGVMADGFNSFLAGVFNAHFTHDPTVLHFSGLCGIRLILQSPGEPVVALVNANTVHSLADGYALLICFPDDAGAIGLPFDRMQSASRADEPRRAAVVEVAFHRDPRSRSKFLRFVDTEQVATSRSLAVLGDVGMKVVLAQAEVHAKITEGFCPFTALRHGSCGLPLGRGPHFQNTIPSTAHDGVLKVAAEAEALAQPTAVLTSGDDRKTDDEGFRAHGSTLAQGLERHTPFIGDNK